jgi:hypothetical protein
MIMIDQSETQRAAAAIRPCFCMALEKSVRLCCACCVPSPQEGKGAKMLGQNHFGEPNWQGFTILVSQIDVF